MILKSRISQLMIHNLSNVFFAATWTCFRPQTEFRVLINKTCSCFLFCSIHHQIFSFMQSRIETKTVKYQTCYRRDQLILYTVNTSFLPSSQVWSTTTLSFSNLTNVHVTTWIVNLRYNKSILSDIKYTWFEVNNYLVTCSTNCRKH